MKFLRKASLWLTRRYRCPDGTPHPTYEFWADGSMHCGRCGAKL